MTNQNVPIKPKPQPKPIINKDSLLYLSDIEVELSESDDNSVYTEICVCDDFDDFDPYYAEDEDEDDSDSDEVKIHPSEK